MDSIKCKELPKEKIEHEDEIERNQMTVTSLSEQPLLVGEINPSQISTTEEPNDEKSRIKALRNRFVAPDGGYGWLVAFGAFLVQFWIAGLIKSYGVIFMEVSAMFPRASASLASWIPAILSTICLVFSPICSMLCQRFSCRSVVFVGGLLCWLGISLSFFATTLMQLCLTFGVLTGFGAGMATTPGIIMTSKYFNKRRALANGICVSGTAAGSIFLPPLIEILVPLYGFKGCILILGSCMLHVCFSAALYRPVEVHQAIVELDEMKKRLGTNGARKYIAATNCDSSRIVQSQAENENSPRKPDMVHSVEDLSTDSTIYYKEKINADIKNCKESSHGGKANCIGTLKRYLDFSLITNPLFLLMASTVMLMAIGCPHFLFYLPSYARSQGISRNEASLLLSISAILDFCGRLGLGYIADLNFFSKSKAYSVSMLTGGIAVLCVPFASSFASFAVIVSFYGFGLGSWFLLIPVLLSEHHGNDAIASSYGLVRLFQGIITLIIPPFIGFTKDLTGDYMTGFYIMGASMILGAFLIHFEPIAKRFATVKKEKCDQCKTKNSIDA